MDETEGGEVPVSKARSKAEHGHINTSTMWHDLQLHQTILVFLSLQSVQFVVPAHQGLTAPPSPPASYVHLSCNKPLVLTS